MKSPRRHQAQVVQTIVYVTLLQMYLHRQEELKRVQQWTRFKRFLHPFSAAIALRAVSTNTSSNNTSIGVTLPAGTTTGDVTLIVMSTNGASSVTEAAGWTVLYKGTSNLCAYRVFVGGDGNPTFTFSGGSYADTCAATYSGIDTSAPIDTSNACHLQNNNLSNCRAPSINPNFNLSQLVLLCGSNNAGGATFPAAPGGFVRQANNTYEPCTAIYDKALTDGTATGHFDLAMAGNGQNVGMSVALKASGATAVTAKPVMPSYSCVLPGSQAASNSRTFSLPAACDLLNNDIVVIGFVVNVATAVITPQSGYAAIGTPAQGSGLYYHKWQTGDPTSVTFSASLGSSSNYFVAVIRYPGDTSKALSVDSSGSTSTAGATSLASPSLAVAGVNELLFVYYGATLNAGGTWTNPVGLSYVDIADGTGSSDLAGYLQNPSNPTGTFTATFSASTPMGAYAVVFQALSAVNCSGTISTPSAPTVTGSRAIKVAKSVSIATSVAPTVSGSLLNRISKSASIATPSAPQVSGSPAIKVAKSGTVATPSAPHVTGSSLTGIIRAATIAASAAHIVGNNTGLVVVARSGAIHVVPVNPFRGAYSLPSQQDKAVSIAGTRATALATIVGNLQPVIVGGGNLPQGSIFSRLLLYVPDYFDKDPAVAAGITLKFAGPSAKISISNHTLTASVIPAIPGQGGNLTLDLTQYSTLTALVAAINANTGYTATVAPGATGSPLNLMEVANIDAIGANATPFLVTTSLLWKLLLVWAWELEDMIQNVLEGLSELEVQTNG